MSKYLFHKFRYLKYHNAPVVDILQLINKNMHNILLLMNSSIFWNCKWILYTRIQIIICWGNYICKVTELENTDEEVHNELALWERRIDKILRNGFEDENLCILFCLFRRITGELNDITEADHFGKLSVLYCRVP